MLVSVAWLRAPRKVITSYSINLDADVDRDGRDAMSRVALGCEKPSREQAAAMFSAVNAMGSSTSYHLITSISSLSAMTVAVTPLRTAGSGAISKRGEWCEATAGPPAASRSKRSLVVPPIAKYVLGI